VKKLILSPTQVLATDELSPEAQRRLRLYYYVFRHGGTDCLPPVIVGTIRSVNDWKSRLEEGYARWVRLEPAIVEIRRREYNTLFRALTTTPYYILDGNNRALAAALNRKDLNVLLLGREVGDAVS
jgi:hypothetical protein